jgi:hypothetical protein
MPERVSYDRADGFIRLESYDTTDIPTMKASVSEAVAIARKEGVRDVLVDASRLKSMPGILEIYNFAAALPVQLRLAILFSDAIAEEIGFFENVARNRSRRVRGFCEYDQAVAWLREGVPAP